MESDEEYRLLSGLESNSPHTARRTHAQRSPGDERLLSYRGRGTGVCGPAQSGGGRGGWRISRKS